jgi:predicted permease
MRWWKRLQLRVWRRAEDDRDLDDEIRFHLAREAELRIESGTAAAEARLSARRDFGNVARVKEVTRTMRSWTSLETLAQDLRFGVRLLRRSRVFAAFSILSLALGIGATTAIFSLFDAIVLRPLPVRDPDRLVALSFAARGYRANNYLTYPHFARMRDTNTTFDGMFAWTGMPRIGARLDGRAEIVSGVMVSGTYYEVLGLRPAHGRLLTADDDRPGNATSVVISHGYWTRRFGASPDVLGQSLTLRDVPFTIVGVQPRGFTGTNVGSSPDVTIPLRAEDRWSTGPRPWEATGWTWLEVIGRLRPGVGFERAQTELTSIFRAIEEASPKSVPGSPTHPPANVFVEAAATGGQSALRRNHERGLRLILMMLAAVVLLASLNVATLLLARSEARRDEMTTRLALGAGRWRIVRQLMTESVLIAMFGGALGLAIAWWGSQTLLRIAVRDTAAMAIDLTPDARVLGFTAIMSGLTCILFGLLPAVRATARLRIAARHEVASRRRRWLDRSLVASQTALSLVLLVLAALFVRSLQNLWEREPGYVRTNVAMFSVDAGLAGKKGIEIANTYRALLDALRALPGVRLASASAVGPISDDAYFIDSVTKLGDRDFSGDQRIRVATNYLSPGYFETLGIPLVAGRDFDARDGPEAPKVVIISEILARKFAGNPIGQSLSGSREVIGVAKDSRYASVKDAPRDVVYSPMFQSAGSIGYAPKFEVRYDGNTADAFRSIRAAVTAVEPSLTIFRLNTLEGYTRDLLSQERLLAMLSSYVGGFALLLACIGLYGLIMYAVTQRTPELGLRMALGSRPSGVQRIVLQESATTVLIGIVVGLGLALWLGRLVQGQLVDLQATDPVALATATLVLAVVACGAAYVPALRASRIDPIIALRRE